MTDKSTRGGANAPVPSEGAAAAGWQQLLTPTERHALLMGVRLAVFQQITGINAIIHYAPMIFGFAGFHSASVSIPATAGVGAINVLLTVVAVPRLDRAGRRPLLLWGWRGSS